MWEFTEIYRQIRQISIQKTAVRRRKREKEVIGNFVMIERGKLSVPKLWLENDSLPCRPF